MKSLYVIMKR